MTKPQSWRRPEDADIRPDDPNVEGRCRVCGAWLTVAPPGHDAAGRDLSWDAYGRQTCEATGEPHVPVRPPRAEKLLRAAAQAEAELELMDLDPSAPAPVRTRRP